MSGGDDLDALIVLAMRMTNEYLNFGVAVDAHQTWRDFGGLGGRRLEELQDVEGVGADERFDQLFRLRQGRDAVGLLASEIDCESQVEGGVLILGQVVDLLGKRHEGI